MAEETRKRIAKLYKEGVWNQDDLTAKAWAEQYFSEKPKPKPKPNQKAKK